MTNWMFRGLVLAGAMVVVRLVQGVLIGLWQTHPTAISVVLLALFIVAVPLWGLRDGREDATANPDPDRRRDLAMVWLLAGLVAGIVSGAVTWLISLIDKSLYVGGLINELTTFAAFTALLVFLPGIAGVTLGRWLIDRRNPPSVRHHGGGDERADTDVFSAVRTDDTAVSQDATMTEGEAGTVATAQRVEQTTPIAYAAESPTDEIRLDDIQHPSSGESPTEEIKLSDYSGSKTATPEAAEETTQEVPSGTDAQQTIPNHTAKDDKR